MFGLNKNMQRQLKGWLYTALLILVGLVFGQEHFPSQRQTSPSAPLPDAVKPTNSDVFILADPLRDRQDHLWTHIP